MLIGTSLTPATIRFGDSSANTAQVIRELATCLAPRFDVPVAQIEQAVLERERARTTALPNGAAIPHCRLPNLDRFGIAISVLPAPVSWDAEGHQVDVVMLIAGPAKSVSDHLRILANSSQLLDSPSLRAKLRTAPDPHSVYSLFAAAEEAIESRRSQVGMLREVRKDAERSVPVDYLADVVARFDW